MNKKGFDAIEKGFYYAIFAFFISAVFLMFIYYVGTEGNSITKVPKGLEDDLFYSRVVNSGCFNYHDIDSGRIMVGVIDWSKFVQYNLDQCYYPMTKEGYGYRLVLKNTDTGQQKSPLQTTNFNNKKRTLVKKVIIYDDKIYGGELTIEVQTP